MHAVVMLAKQRCCLNSWWWRVCLHWCGIWVGVLPAIAVTLPFSPPALPPALVPLPMPTVVLHLQLPLPAEPPTPQWAVCQLAQKLAIMGQISKLKDVSSSGRYIVISPGVFGNLESIFNTHVVFCRPKRGHVSQTSITNDSLNRPPGGGQDEGGIGAGQRGAEGRDLSGERRIITMK